MTRSRGFLPIARADARILILGSLPGRESLRRKQYYAHPSNAFWPLMGALYGAGPEFTYDARVRRLRAARIAVWDVLAAAHRAGSADAAIDRASVRVNDFVGFLAAHPRIELIAFNGRAAEALFLRHVLAALDARCSAIRRVVLPSTSPAHATLSPARKLVRWRRALTPS